MSNLQFLQAAKAKKPNANSCYKCGAWKGQLGLEPTPEMYIEHLTEIFNEVKRVLKKEGTFWLNIGDTYSGSNTGHTGPAQTKWQSVPRGCGKSLQSQIGLSAKCLCMIPERLAWSLIQNGWILRNKIPWIKNNPMPESVKDRFSRKWEYVFYFVKSQRNYFDLDAVREPCIEETLARAKRRSFPNLKRVQSLSQNPQAVDRGKGTPQPHPKGKNPGDVWIVNTSPCPIKGVHFATFPEELCRKAIIPGCPQEVCKQCGKPRERISKRTFDPGREKTNSPYPEGSTGLRMQQRRQAYRKHGMENPPPLETIGWTDCGCNAGFEPGIVLDPFCGSGTVGVVAKKLNRRFIGIDIKEEYCEMARKRIEKVAHQKSLF